MKQVRSKLSALCLVAVGSLTMLGDLLGMNAIKGLGLASHASPAPKVFIRHISIQPRLLSSTPSEII